MGTEALEKSGYCNLHVKAAVTVFHTKQNQSLLVLLQLGGFLKGLMLCVKGVSFFFNLKIGKKT